MSTVPQIVLRLGLRCQAHAGGDLRHVADSWPKFLPILRLKRRKGVSVTERSLRQRPERLQTFPSEAPKTQYSSGFSAIVSLDVIPGAPYPRLSSWPGS